MKRWFIRWLMVVTALVAALVTASATAQATPQQAPPPGQPAAQQPATPAEDPRVADPRFTDQRFAAPVWTAPVWTDPLFHGLPVAMVRVAHLSPNAPAVDLHLLWLDGAIVPVPQAALPTAEPEIFEEAQAELAGLEYGQVSDYVLVPAGTHTLSVTDPANGGLILHQVELSLIDGAYYTLAGVGFILGTDEELDARVQAEEQAQQEGFFTWLEGLFAERDPADLSFRVEVYDDEPGAFPRAGDAHIRVIHAAPGTADLDIWARWSDLEGVETAPAGAQPTAAGVQPARPQVTADELEGSLEVMVQPQDALLNVVGPDGYAQNLRGSHILSGLQPGDYVITATRTGYETARENVEVVAGDTTTVQFNLAVAGGEAVQPQLAPATPAAPTPPADPAAAPAAPDTAAVTPVDPTLVGPDVTNFLIASGVAYPFASSYEPVRAYGFDLELWLAGTTTLVHEFPEVLFEPGAIYTIFVIGTAVADVPLEAIILNDARLVSSPPEETNGEVEEDEEEDPQDRPGAAD